jgi:M-phase inducer tyrosine phosphatase
LAQPWEKRDPFRLPRTSSTGAVGFGLREQLHKPNAVFFNVGDVRGSSPAASLAADLSQNFRLDSEAR